MHRALITGSGQLGSALFATAGQFGWEVELASHQQLDVTRPAEVRRVITDHLPDYILHTAALTRVNYCEEDSNEAHLVNAFGTENVVAAAAEISAKVVYFSTDYVFDGTKQEPWVETDLPNPLNEYGRSKLAGEEVVQQYLHGHIVRTSGVFGRRTDGQDERNFLSAVFHKLSTTEDEALVVADQFTCLTSATRLAEMVFELLQVELPRLVHLTNRGANSWFGWAQLVARAAGFSLDRVRAVATADYPSEAVRPVNGVLSSIHPEAREMVERSPLQPEAEAYIATLLN